jgi:hypothetical protein
LVFPHEMHKSAIEDVCWNPRTSDPNSLFPMLASGENEESLQVWKPSEEFFAEEIDMMDNALHLISDLDLE